PSWTSTTRTSPSKGRQPKRREGQMQRKGAAAEHGTMARYRRGCRCELCRAAKAIGRLPQEHRELWALLADPGDPRHGTTTGYRVGCRCERCREAKSAAKAR